MWWRRRLTSRSPPIEWNSSSMKKWKPSSGWWRSATCRSPGAMGPGRCPSRRPTTSFRTGSCWEGRGGVGVQLGENAKGRRPKAKRVKPVAKAAAPPVAAVPKPGVVSHGSVIRLGGDTPADGLRAEDLVKAFKERRVVSGVSIAIQPGEVVGLLGPNGAGKTTTFYMILGLIRPDRGRVVLNGEESTSLPVYHRARRGIGFLPQEASVFRRLTVKENLMAILEILPLSAAERKERADHLLHELSIAHLADAPAYSLSGGERL